ncbi:coiled-coil domain-containing protein [Plantibacter sp. YIM 135347]|uniref:coiled-coil domain-containing protein n=1 Tax=Plantibacter sp. YIM 135347 TaxID=3423919 RepID=UPI003D3308B7
MRAPLIRATAIGAAVLIALSIAAPAHADDYPSWDEVQAAKNNEATQQAETDRITSLLQGLEAESARLGDEATATAAAAGEAKAALEQQTERTDALETQAAAAATTSATTKRQAGSVIVQMSRMGGTDSSLAIVLSGKNRSSDLLYRLSAIGKLSESSSATYAQAVAASNTSAALSKQATEAEAERTRLSAEADTSYQSAVAASKAADAAVAEQQANRDRLYAQLATLKNTTAEVEKAYAAGEAKRQQDEDNAAAAGGGGGGGSPAPPGGVSSDPDAAKAYARGAVASYGWGDNEYQCLLRLWTRESNWRVDAYNPAGPAYGIPQSLPGSKMASAGDDWRTNPATQINWGLSYISGRYGAPCGAWAHSESYNWY